MASVPKDAGSLGQLEASFLYSKILPSREIQMHKRQLTLLGDYPKMTL